MREMQDRNAQAGDMVEMRKKVEVSGARIVQHVLRTMCLPARPPVCPPACLPVRLPASLCACVPVCLCACLQTEDLFFETGSKAQGYNLHWPVLL